MTEASSISPTPPMEMAHILFMDIVAYSMLRMDRQQHVLQNLQDAVRSTPTFLRAQAQDQLIRLPTGDGMALVFFQDPEAPVRCALELAKVLRNNPDIKLRMGIHTGPVYRVADINANRNVAGGGINIAQRVMDCGDTGHILVSSAEAEVLGHVSAWCATLHDLGEVQVKHGVHVRLYNFYTEDVGNTGLPAKVRAQQKELALVAAKVRRKKRARPIAVGLALLLFASVGTWLSHSRNAHALSKTDTIVLADFSNKTRDPVFDDALRQGLAVQLEQSPFLNLISSQRTQQTLRMMRLSADAKLTPEIAHELCQRTGSAAVIEGSIAQIGTKYLLTVRATNCLSGEPLASTEAQASDKDHVLSALERIASVLRNKLGESLSTIQKLDAPIVQATTPSLEALQAYALGGKVAQVKGDFAGSIPFFQRAIELDPSFAMAYAAMGTNFGNLGQRDKAIENLTRAFQLRDRVSEREKLYISASYYSDVTGELEQAAQQYRLMTETYPREMIAFGNLSTICSELGRYDEALSAARATLRLMPTALGYSNLIGSYMFLNRFAEAKATAAETQTQHFESPLSHLNLYLIAFVEQDESLMEREAAAVRNSPGQEAHMLLYEALSAAYMGEFKKARAIFRRAVSSAQREQDVELAAGDLADGALQEALVGDSSLAKHGARAALAMAHSQDVEEAAALPLAFAGDSQLSEALAASLSNELPTDTLVQSVFLPMVRALNATTRGNSLEAIEMLESSTPYELGRATQMYPAYIRGYAYLATKDGAAAAAEFQKILEHRGIVPNTPVGALAHLGLARACAMYGDATKARAKYQDFLTLWKDADPDIPILKQAKAEYAKLQ